MAFSSWLGDAEQELIPIPISISISRRIGLTGNHDLEEWAFSGRGKEGPGQTDRLPAQWECLCREAVERAEAPRSKDGSECWIVLDERGRKAGASEKWSEKGPKPWTLPRVVIL